MAHPKKMHLSLKGPLGPSSLSLLSTRVTLRREVCGHSQNSVKGHYPTNTGSIYKRDKTELLGKILGFKKKSTFLC